MSSAGVLSTMLFVLAAPTVVAQSEQTKLPPMTAATPDLRYQEPIPPKISVTPNDEIDKVVYTLGAQISGRSRLILDDGTAQWHHHEFAAPGAAGEAILPMDMTGVGSRGSIQPGQYFYFQFWFRDAKEGGSGFNLSNGVKARFTP